MHDMHDVITVGVPLIAILAGILFNRSDVKDLRAEMRDGFSRVHADLAALKSEVHADIAVLQSDMRQFTI
jgi:hypothetical protein